MSDHSWQIETKNGGGTRIDAVDSVEVNLDADYLQMNGSDGEALFVAPMSSLSYAKRVEPSGMKDQSGRVGVAIPVDDVARVGGAS